MICDQTELVSLSQDLQKALLDHSFADVKIRVGAVIFPAHKIFLVSRSTVFKAMFAADMRESQDNVVDIEDANATAVKAMLQYIYTGQTRELSMDLALDLYTVADRYVISELKERCKRFIVKEIGEDDVCNVAVLADLHGDEELKKAAKRALKKNFKIVLKSSKWREFSREYPFLYSELIESVILEEHDERDVCGNQVANALRPMLPGQRISGRNKIKFILRDPCIR